MDIHNEQTDLVNGDNWISLTEYSVKYQVSVSTLRRYIKENRVEFQKVKGKYFISDQPYSLKKRGRKAKGMGDTDSFVTPKRTLLSDSLDPQVKDLLKLREELSELKMYVVVLEKKLGI